MTEGPADLPPAHSDSVWRYAMASRAHVVVDAAAYFELMRDTMRAARQRIFLIGWDFDLRIRFIGGRRWWNKPERDRFPARLGAFFPWLVRRKPGLKVFVLKWNFGALKFVFRGSMALDLLRWLFNRSIDFTFDSAHPLGCSHHQKIAVVDDKVAMCGGIDMTTQRWDTRDHLPDDPRRKGPRGKPYPPWHDVTMMMEGEVSSALSDLGRERWAIAGGKAMGPCAAQDETPWPRRLHAEFNDVEIGIARTRAAYRGVGAVREIEALFVEQIASARQFVYAETQYFASRRIAEAVAARMAEPDPPEFCIINPLSAEGWLEQAAMDTARLRLLHAIGEVDVHNRFRVFVPYCANDTPIYVHAKLMIVDDKILRIGSANMNNRSMGLDSECDVFLDSNRPANAHIVPAITRLRHSLLAEHCGIEPEEVTQMLDRYGSMAAMIAAVGKVGPMSGKRLEPFALRPLTEAEKTIADSSLLDPERPGAIFEPIGKRGLFRRGGILRRPK